MLQNMLDLQKKLYERGLQSPYLTAQTNARLGKQTGGSAATCRSPSTSTTKNHPSQQRPAFNNLHNDPTYQAPVARLEIPARE